MRGIVSLGSLLERFPLQERTFASYAAVSFKVNVLLKTSLLDQDYGSSAKRTCFAERKSLFGCRGWLPVNFPTVCLQPREWSFLEEWRMFGGVRFLTWCAGRRRWINRQANHRHPLCHSKGSEGDAPTFYLSCVEPHSLHPAFFRGDLGVCTRV